MSENKENIQVADNTESSKVYTQESFFDLASKMLEDNKLTSEEIHEINKYYEWITNWKGWVIYESVESRNNLLMEITSKKSLENIIKNSLEYKNRKKSFLELNRSDRRQVQRRIWVKDDWIFWINTFLYYKKSPLSKLFTLKEISNWMIVEDIAKFIKSFSEMKWVDWEALATLDLEEWDFVLYDEKSGNITIYNNNRENKKLTISVNEHMTFVLKNILINNDTQSFYKHLSLLLDKNDKRDYILHFKKVITEYNLFKEVRNLLSTKNWDLVILNLNTNLIERYITAFELFWDLKAISFNWNIFLNTWNLEFRYNNKKLYVRDGQVFSILESSEEGLSDNLKIKETKKQYEVKKKLDLSNKTDLKEAISLLKFDDIKNYIISLKRYSDQKKFVLDLRKQIVENNLFEQMCKMFTHNKWSWKFVCDFKWIRAFERHLTAFDLFWNFKNIKKWNKIYNSNMYYFINWKYPLYIKTWTEVIVSNKKSVNEIKELNNYPFLANKLWKFLADKWPINTWKNSCWEAVKNILRNFWIRWRMSWNWCDWWEILDNKPNQFKKVPIKHPEDAKAGWILVYLEWAENPKASKKRKKYWHVEIKWMDNRYYSYYASQNPGWSARIRSKQKYEELKTNYKEYQRFTWFIWYVYYPTQKET